MDMVDVLIHVHPNLASEERTALEQAIARHDGILSAHFDNAHPHALKVEYDPANLSVNAILDWVRQDDPSATAVGL